MATALERENLEAHVDLCEQRYVALEGRIVKGVWWLLAPNEYSQGQRQ